MTDDQDLTTLRPDVHPNLFAHLGAEGTQFTQFFAPVSLCCPSRVSLLRAQHAHNHNVTYVSPPYGGWPVFNSYGYTHSTILDFLQAEGYGTYYTGKLMNGHTSENCAALPVSGVTEGEFLVDPWTYDYWSAGFCSNGKVSVHEGEYSTDVVAGKALGMLERALGRDAPFFVAVAPIGPHSHIAGVGARDMLIPRFHPRHAHLFANDSIERHEGFNPDHPSGVSWVQHLPRLNDTQVAHLDEWHRARLRALQPVDEMVGDIVAALDAAGQLDNTYIIYTSDNGFALGTHRRQPGKTLGFEEDTRVPLFVRGPGVPRGRVDTHGSWGIVDLGRTILDLAGAKTSYENDGALIDLHGSRAAGAAGSGAAAPSPAPSAEVAATAAPAPAPSAVASEAQGTPRHALAEYWVLAVEEGPWASAPRPNNTYRTLRLADGAHAYTYSVWCTGERELYDLSSDPHQVRNLLQAHNALGRFAAFNASGPALGPRAAAEATPAALDPAHSSAVGLAGGLAPETRRVAERLDALLLVLKTCRGETCAHPWPALFPGGAVGELADALDAKYDAFFAGLPRVRFDECALGYQARREKPLWDDAWAFRAQAAETEDLVVQSSTAP